MRVCIETLKSQSNTGSAIIICTYKAYVHVEFKQMRYFKSEYITTHNHKITVSTHQITLLILDKSPGLPWIGPLIVPGHWQRWLSGSHLCHSFVEVTKSNSLQQVHVRDSYHSDSQALDYELTIQSIFSWQPHKPSCQLTRCSAFPPHTTCPDADASLPSRVVALASLR